MRARPRTDVDPPRVELPPAGGISSCRPGPITCYSLYVVCSLACAILQAAGSTRLPVVDRPHSLLRRLPAMFCHRRRRRRRRLRRQFVRQRRPGRPAADRRLGRPTRLLDSDSDSDPDTWRFLSLQQQSVRFIFSRPKTRTIETTPRLIIASSTSSGLRNDRK